MQQRNGSLVAGEGGGLEVGLVSEAAGLGPGLCEGVDRGERFQAAGAFAATQQRVGAAVDREVADLTRLVVGTRRDGTGGDHGPADAARHAEVDEVLQGGGAADGGLGEGGEADVVVDKDRDADLLAEQLADTGAHHVERFGADSVGQPGVPGGRVRAGQPDRDAAERA